MLDLKYINGRDLIDFLNSNKDMVDETGYFSYEYEKQSRVESQFILYFSIDYNYFTRDNRIYINSNGEVDAYLQEPFDSGGQTSELENIVKKLYLKQLEIDIRDNKISDVIDTEEDKKEKYKNKILTKLEDLTNKIKSGEETPTADQDSNLLSSIEDKLDDILNAWYY